MIYPSGHFFESMILRGIASYISMRLTALTFTFNNSWSRFKVLRPRPAWRKLILAQQPSVSTLVVANLTCSLKPSPYRRNYSCIYIGGSKARSATETYSSAYKL